MVHAGWTGRVIDGRYAVESVIGAGGMGLVLKARHEFTGAEVAVKVLKSELELDPEVQMRFLAEARAPTAIGHPGIVSVIDAGKAPDGLLYLVMELLVGRQLRVPLQRGELTAADMRRILLELLDVLGAAHARGFVHRDLKPENVFLAGPAAGVKLLDFGIAKVLDAGLARVRTATNATLGTPAYMAPEQFHDPSGVDARADLWAVGVMAYEMLGGRLPFRGDTTAEMLVAVASLEPDPIRAHVPNAPPALEAFFQRALARDRAHRFATAAEMAQAVAALPLGTTRPQRPASRSNAPIAHAAASAPGMPIDAGTDPGMTMATGVGGGRAIATGATAVSPTRAASGPASTSASRPAAAGPSRRSWVIGLGLASLVSIAVIILAVVATRSRSAGTATGSGSGSGSATALVERGSAQRALPADAAVVAVAPADAAVVAVAPADAATARDPRDLAIDTGWVSPNAKAPPDAGAPTRPRTVDAGAAAPVDPYPEDDETTAASAEDACKKGCAATIAKCGNVSAACVSDCLAKPALRKCFTLPLGSCNEVSTCGLRAVCGPNVLRGTRSCADTAKCQLECAAGDLACGCACAMTMAPRHAQALAAFDACGINCNFNVQCAQTKCSYQINTCVNQ